MMKVKLNVLFSVLSVITLGLTACDNGKGNESSIKYPTPALKTLQELLNPLKSANNNFTTTFVDHDPTGVYEDASYVLYSTNDMLFIDDPMTGSTGVKVLENGGVEYFTVENNIPIGTSQNT